MDTISLNGMVLSSMPIGEYDRRILLLTKELGRVSAFVRGARRQNSALMAAARPFATGRFELRQGRDSFTLVTASINEYFEKLAADVQKTAYGYYFAEAAGYSAAENADGTELLNLLYVSLKALESESLTDEFVRLVYELRLFAANGEYPQVFECFGCRKPLTSGWLYVQRGSCCCGACRGADRAKALHLDESAMYTLQFIITAPIGKLYSFCVSDEVFSALRQVCECWKEKCHYRDFKSLRVIKEMQDFLREADCRRNDG